jgi:hypothetical protein
MTVFALLVGLALGVLWLRRRKARRLDERAGLMGERPTFAVEPPIRSLIRGEDHRW